MKETPILMNGEMVSATRRIKDPKWQTRRTRGLEKINEHPEWYQEACQDGAGDWIFWGERRGGHEEATKQLYPNGGGIRCPYGQVGDRLWVRETWAPKLGSSNALWYAADFVRPKAMSKSMGFVWHPSIFMRRWMSRLLLELTDVRCQRIQDISEADCAAEGIRFPDDRPITCYDGMYRARFEPLWDSINKKRGFGWGFNPWVFALSFKIIEVQR